MKFYDLTLTLSPDLAVWDDDPPVEIRQLSSLDGGDSCTLSEIIMSVHTGTHVDAPGHFIPDGPGVDTLNPDILTGLVQVVDLRGHPVITDRVLSACGSPPDTERLLLLTDNTEKQILHAPAFIPEFTAVDASGARWLKEAGIRLVGIDAISIAPYKKSAPTHQILLEAGIVVVEGVDLTGIRPGEYRLMVMPLKIKNCDGAPARVILEDKEDD